MIRGMNTLSLSSEELETLIRSLSQTYYEVDRPLIAKLQKALDEHDHR